MSKYIIEEKPNLYGVLVYSNNPTFINGIDIRLKKENINLKIKKIKKSNVEYYDYANKSTNIKKVLVDLTDNKTKFSENDLFSIQKENNYIYILNSSFKNSHPRVLNKNVIIVDKITKYSASKIAEVLTSFISGETQGLVDLTKKQNSDLKKKYKYCLPLLILSLIMFLPYVLNIYLYFNNYIFDKYIFRIVSVNETRKMCPFDLEIKKGFKSIISGYIKMPYLDTLYQKSFNYASNLFEESIYLCNLTNYIENVNLKFRNSVSGEFAETKKPNLTFAEIQRGLSRRYLLYPDLDKSINNYRKELLFIARFLDFTDKYLYSPQKKYFLLLLQNSTVLSPTGGVVENLIVFSAENGYLRIINETKPSRLDKQFKGRVENIHFPDTPFLNYDFDKTLNLQDKFTILKTMFSESLNININGLFIAEEQSLDGLMNAWDLNTNKNITFLESYENYRKILMLLKTKNVDFILEEGAELIESRDVLKERTQNIGECNLRVDIIQEKEQNSSSDYTDIMVVGRKENNLIRLSFYVTDSTNGLVLFNINGGGLTDVSNRNSFIKYESGKGEYFLPNANRLINRENVEFINQLGTCKNGFNVVFEKQPGNNSVRLTYNFSTDHEYSLYLNDTLTYRANKFYNTKSFNLSEDTVFYFAR